MHWRRFTVPVEGGTLHGEARGETPALCFIHGMGGSLHDWDRLIAALPPAPSGALPLVRHDMRGFGASEAVEGVAFSHADDLLALIDALGVERIAPVGLSMGGGVALNFALSHPQRVSRLVLVSPAMVGWDWSAEWKAQWRHVTKAARAGDMALARERWFLHPMFDQVRAGPLADELRAEIAAYHGRQWLRTDERPELPDVDRLPTLAVPTLLLSGGRDVPDMRLIADVIAGSAPQVTRIDYPQAGHMLHIECADAIARAIADFVTA